MELLLLATIPVLAGLLCLITQSRAAWERLNLAGFGLVALLSVRLAARVASSGPITAFDGFLRADALSALVIFLTGFVALVSAIYAVGHFRRDEAIGRITHAQLRHYYVLTPLFVSAMLFVPLADNLGVLWEWRRSSTRKR